MWQWADSGSSLCWVLIGGLARGGFSLVWFSLSLVFGWALFRTINVDGPPRTIWLSTNQFSLLTYVYPWAKIQITSMCPISWATTNQRFKPAWQQSHSWKPTWASFTLDETIDNLPIVKDAYKTIKVNLFTFCREFYIIQYLETQQQYLKNIWSKVAVPFVSIAFCNYYFNWCLIFTIVAPYLHSS